MSENPRSRATITLGDTRQVGKREGHPLDDSLGDSQLTGRKRSVKDRLGCVGDSTTGFDKKRLRVDGREFSQGDFADGRGLRENDLRFRIMQKNIYNNSQGNNPKSMLDLRDLLSRPAQSSSDSIAARPNVHEQSDARERFPKLGNGKLHMSELREPKQNIAVSRMSRQGMAEVNGGLPRMREPNSSGIMGRVPSTPEAGSFSQMSILRSSSSPWTSEKLIRRSPHLTLRQRSPDVAFRWRSPDVPMRQRSPNDSLSRRSPADPSGRRSPEVPLRRRSPGVPLRRRSPDVPLRQRSPDVSFGSTSSDSPLRRRSPNVPLRRRSPHVAMRHLSPDVVSRRQLPDSSLRHRSPNVSYAPNISSMHISPDVALSRRSPDIALTTPGVYSPPRREDDFQRGPSARSYNDRGVGTHLSKDDHVFPLPRPSVSFMRTAASPAAHAHMSKDVHDVFRHRPSVPYMTTSALPSVNAKAMIPLPTPSMPPSNLVQRSSFLVNGSPTVEVDCFLHSLGLEKYSINFKVEEVDDMCSMREMSESDLKDLGIPMGPRKILLLALQSRYKRQVP